MTRTTQTPARRADLATRYRMIESIEIKNFRCFKHLRVKDCALINVVVGENGTGKTTLMEAIYLALCANPQGAMTLRAHRGNDGVLFAGRPESIVDALSSEFFYEMERH